MFHSFSFLKILLLNLNVVLSIFGRSMVDNETFTLGDSYGLVTDLNNSPCFEVIKLPHSLICIVT